MKLRLLAKYITKRPIAMLHDHDLEVAKLS